MKEFRVYAGSRPGGSLEPFSFKAGPIGPEEVEIAVTHCGFAARTSQCPTTSGDSPSIDDSIVASRLAR